MDFRSRRLAAVRCAGQGPSTENWSGFEFRNRSRADDVLTLCFSADPLSKVVAHGYVPIPSADLSVAFQILRFTRSFTTSIAIRSTALQASVIGLV
jgi:hypothetical protein